MTRKEELEAELNRIYQYYGGWRISPDTYTFEDYAKVKNELDKLCES